MTRHENDFEHEEAAERLWLAALHEAGHVVGDVFGPRCAVPAFVEAYANGGGFTAPIGNGDENAVPAMISLRCGPTAEHILGPSDLLDSLCAHATWRDIPGASGTPESDVEMYDELRRRPDVSLLWPFGVLIRSAERERIVSLGAYCRRLIRVRRAEILRLAEAIVAHPSNRLERSEIAEVLNVRTDGPWVFHERRDFAVPLSLWGRSAR